MHHRGAASLFPLLLALSSQLHAAAGAESATPEERSRNVTFGTGQPLRSLPGAHILQGQSNAYTIDATFGPVSVTGYDADGSLLCQFTNPGLMSGGQAYMFGPTLRVKAGQHFTMVMTNGLVGESMGEDPSSLNGSVPQHFHGTYDTNMHTHGVVVGPGARVQAATMLQSGDIIQSDNIFVQLGPRPNVTSPSETATYNYTLPRDHSPGLYWYHPHKHGSTTLQSAMANGIIIIEDEPSYLPNKNNCTQIRKKMASAPEVLLNFQLINFNWRTVSSPPPGHIPNATTTPLLDKKDLANIQFVSNDTHPDNTMCCDGKHYAYGGKATVGPGGSGEKLILVNGGYKPVTEMKSGQWERWRLVFSGYQFFMVLTIQHADNLGKSANCEIQLIAKDGMYLMDIPRKVDNFYLTAASRAEALVRCHGPPGKKYVLSAGRRTTQLYGEAMRGPLPLQWGYTNESYINATGHPPLNSIRSNEAEQDVVMTIVMKKGKTEGSLKERACTPLRPDYAPDLRDEALEEAGNPPMYNMSNSFAQYYGYGYGCVVSKGQNRKAFMLPDPDPIIMPLGQVVEWTFTNTAMHPLHLHVNHFQIIELKAGPQMIMNSFFEIGDYHDTLHTPFAQGTYPQVPSPEALIGSSMVLRVQPGPFTGYTVLHCHFLQHEDMGCMKVVKYECPGYEGANTEQPLDCTNWTYPVKGTWKA